SLVIVCDGIGGHQAGDVASKLTCNLMATYFQNHYDNEPERWFKQALRKVNNAVYDEAQENSRLKGMGTTIVAAILGGDDIYILNVGDSRCYYISEKGELIQITEDHSLINDLMKKEGMDLEMAKELGQHVITRAVGVWPAVEGDIYRFNEPYRYLMLCSDGLHNYVSEEAILETINSELTIEEKCRKLVDLANEAGGFDNITVALVEG
ncbi:MAG: Stp1/IreP family PP2C-type Ser/Thr phosphatase, partial [Erysipelotrichaceae bacterium]|nr:Stp1/IreP family PP2C-type Ser/Thr phosphatase [Erysipelotrichaceae bacterium]